MLATARVVPAFTLSPTLVLAVFLPPLLFDAGFSMRAAAVRRELPWILLLGLAGAVLTAAVSFGLLLAAGVPSDEGILLAAILAATDPVSVFAALRRLRTPERLRVALEGESLANDGVAVLLFVVALAVVQRRVIDAPGVLGLVFSQAAGGLLIGIGIGLLTRRILASLPRPLQIVVTVFAAYAGYLLADRIGASGLLAVISISLIVGTAYEPSTHHQVHRFWRQLGFHRSGIQGSGDNATDSCHNGSLGCALLKSAAPRPSEKGRRHQRLAGKRGSMLFSLGLLRRIARELPRYGKLTYCLYRDPRVPQRNKLALTALAIRLFVEKAPKDVVAEHQERIALGTSVFDQDLRRSREGLRGRLNELRERGLAVAGGWHEGCPDPGCERHGKGR